MTDTPHPFYTLRQAIRRAYRQYRHNDDNSQSIFHPKKGFISAYDIADVENALDIYETTLGSEYFQYVPEKSPEEILRDQAHTLLECDGSGEAVSLARSVLAYLNRQETLRTLRSLKGVGNRETPVGQIASLFRAEVD